MGAVQPGRFLAFRNKLSHVLKRRITMKRLLITLPLVLLAAFSLLLAVDTQSAAAQNSNALWFITYWNNPNQAGDPVATRSEGSIDHDWGNSSPVPGVVTADNWSARWTSYVDLAPGTYRFTVTSDDGARIFLGTRHILSDWVAGPIRTNVTTVSLLGGTYPIAVDYFEATGPAELTVRWERTGSPISGAADVTTVPNASATPSPTPAPATWQGQYFNNLTLSGTPILTRNEPGVNFNWGTGSPITGVVTADNWSARYTASLNLIPGRYRFSVTADDGVRLRLNNALVVDRWLDQEATTTFVELDWAGGNLPVQVDYYERTGTALVSVTWTRTGSTPDTGGSAVGTVRVSGLNIRTGPAVSFQLITTIPFGSEVILLSRNADATWVYGIIPDGRQGWMAATYLTTSFSVQNLPVQ
jgi:hypothetical protein